ncbi:hypothetical protein DL767_004864 [Monosporascus sp. MG133]|nr:hypothetical protein DL767_004864 [Monosporascus sp. MG133]
MRSGKQYERAARTTYLEPRRSQFMKLQSGNQETLLKHLNYEQILQSIDDAIVGNSKIATRIFETGCQVLSEVAAGVFSSDSWHGIATDEDCSIARACIRGLFRDWSHEGAPERNAAHAPILNALRKEFGHRTEKSSVRVLVPGAGLGRLVHSASELGFSVEGVDVSYHTLLTCLCLIGGGTQDVRQTLYPWALGFSNHVSRQDQLNGVRIPDLHLHNPIKVDHNPSAKGVEQQIVLRRGGFVETYGTPNQADMFSAVLTCYFIDTAPNFLEYVYTAWNCLEAGGIWINIGPLLWNIEENGPAGNGHGDTDRHESWKANRKQRQGAGAILELAGEEVLKILRAKGFIIEHASDNVGSSMYVGNNSSMLRYTYDMMFWSFYSEFTTDMPPSIELQPRKPGHSRDIINAISVVNGYMPVLDLNPTPDFGLSTTVISAFFPPPTNEPLMRKMGPERFIRDPDAYIQGLRLMVTTCSNLILFLPPGDLAEEIRAQERHDVKVYDHFPSIWDFPHLRGRKSEFYGRQVRLCREGGARKVFYGEPHSWGAWNAKAFLVLDAMRLDPFKTTHFIWLDVRMPSMAQAQVPSWPHPTALPEAYNIMPISDRVVIAGMRPLRPLGTAYWPVTHEDGTKVDTFMEDIHAISAGLYFGSKIAMARLAKAQLVLLERDLARGYYVGREEFQLSYLHYEFPDLLYVLELFSQKPFPPGVYWYTFFYWYMSRPHDWANLGLDADPVTDDANESTYL